MLSIFTGNRVKKDLLIIYIVKYEGVHSNLAMAVYSVVRKTWNFIIQYYSKRQQFMEFQNSLALVTLALPGLTLTLE